MTSARKRTQLIDFVAEAKLHRHSLVLWPANWKNFKHGSRLRWQTKPFVKASLPRIPDKPGVYAFLIQPAIADLQVAYLMYIGQTDRSLRTRFGEYLKEMDRPMGRPAVSVILNLYIGYLHFCCAPVELPQSPLRVEERLIAAFLPPVNRKLPAGVSRIVRAFT